MGRKCATPFDLKTFLPKVDGKKSILKFRKKRAIFSQGDAADEVFYILEGKIKLTVLSSRGKVAIIAILEQGDFFGEACLSGQLIRTATATVLAESTILRIDKPAMIRVLRQ